MTEETMVETGVAASTGPLTCRVHQTDETRQYTRELRAFGAAAVPKVRVTIDAEGFPVIPGRLGTIDYGGPEAGAGPHHGERRLYVYTDRVRMIPKLLAIPGVHRWQMGDTEARLWFPAEVPECLRQVCRVIRARTRAVRPDAADRLRAWKAERGQKSASELPCRASSDTQEVR